MVNEQELKERIKALVAQDMGRQRTALSPDEEASFQTWYKHWADKSGIDSDPDHPLHKYDYRGAYKAGLEPRLNPKDNLYHWASKFKDFDHPNRFVNGIDTKYQDEPYEPTKASDIYEKQYTKATGKQPYRLLPPEEQKKEALKAKVRGLIVDDMLSELPEEMRSKLEGPSLTVERGTLEEQRRLASGPDTPESMMTRAMYGRRPGGAFAPILEKESRGEKLTPLEYAGSALYHGIRPLLDVASGSVISDMEKEMYPGISKEKWEELQYTPQNIAAVLTSAIGSLAGLMAPGGVPGSVSKAYRILADTKLLPKIMENPALSKLAKQLLVRSIHGAGLAPTLASSEAFKGLQEVPENLLHGVLLGEVFAAGGAINPNNKILGWLLRQTANRVMAGAAGQYRPDFLKNVAKGLATGEWNENTIQQVFDELLMGLFSHKGTSAKQIEELLPQLRAAEARRVESKKQDWELKGAAAEKLAAGRKEAGELAGLKVSPDIVKLGEKLAEYEYAKNIPQDKIREQGNYAIYEKRLYKLRAEIVELYKKAKGGMREGEAIPEEMTALEKMKERVPGMATPPPEKAPEPTPKPAPKPAPEAAKKYELTTTAKPQPKEVERTPVVPHQALKDLHTPDHYVYSDGEFKKTEGQDVAIVPGVDTFLHKGGSGSKRVWVVIEGKSGLPIGVDTRSEKAIEMAQAAIGQPNFGKLIEDSLAKSGPSPRYFAAEGAASKLLQTPTDLGIPDAFSELEQRILAGESKGAGTVQSPQEFNAFVGAMVELPVRDAIKSAAAKGEPGVASSLVRSGLPKLIAERPYGKLVRNGDGSWSMHLNPGVDPESLRMAPGRPVEAKTPEERPKIRVPVPEATELDKQVADMMAEGAKQAAEVAKSEAARKKELGLTTKIPTPDILTSEPMERGEDATARLERGKERAAKQRALGKATGKKKAPVSDAEAQRRHLERNLYDELLKKGGPKGLTVEEIEYVTAEGPKEKDYEPPWYKFMPKKRELPPQKEIPRTGTYTAVMTDDGGIYTAREPFRSQPWHHDLVDKLGIPPDRVVSGGYVRDGVYEAEQYSEAAKYARQEKIRIAEEAKRKYRESLLETEMPKIKGLTVEDISWVMEDARKKGKETRGPFLGYLWDKATGQAAPLPPPEDVPPAEVARKSAIPEKKWWFGMKAVNNLKRMGEGGQQAAQGLLNYARKRMQWTQRDLYGISAAANIVEQYTDVGSQQKPSILNVPARRADYQARAEQTGQRIREIIEGKRKPADEVEARAIDIIRTRLNEIQKMAEDLKLTASGVYGEKKWKAIKNYYPHEWLGLEALWEGEIHRNMKDVIIENIAKNKDPELYKDPATKAKSLEMAERYWEDMRHDLKTAKYGHLEMQRILDDEFVEVLRRRWEAKFPGKPFPLQRNEDVSVLFKYLAGADNRLAWLQEFGKDENHKGWQVPEKVLGWAQKMENQDNREYMYRRFHDILRRDNYASWQKASRFIQTFQLTKMTFSAIPNALQWLTNTVPNVSTKAALQAVWDTAKFYGAAGPGAKKEARDFFSATGAGRLSAEMQEALAARPEVAARISDHLLKFYGFTGTEFYNRLYSAFAGKRYAEHLADKLQKSGEMGWRSPQYRAELKKLGFEAADIEALIKDGPLTAKNAEKLAEASFEMTRLTQFMTESFFLPGSWSNPAVRLLTQFKNFSYNQSSLLYNEPMKQAYNFMKSGGKTGDLMPLIKTAVILPLAGAAIYHFKKEGTSKLFGLTFYEKMLAGKSEPLKWFSYIFNAGGFGIGSDIVASLAMGKSGLANLIGGPTISDIAELAGAAADTYKDLSKGLDWTKNRAETIGFYWARFGGKTSPTAKIILNKIFPEYKRVTDLNQWSRVAREFYKKYKETYMLKGPEVADEIWQAFMETQGKEYEEFTAKIGTPRRLTKPTRREIETWWEEQGAPPSERVPMSGKKGGMLGEFYY